MNYIKKHSCFLCLEEHYSNAVVHTFHKGERLGGKRACIAALCGSISTESRELDINSLRRHQLPQNRILEVTRLANKRVFENPGWVDYECSMSSVAIRLGAGFLDNFLKFK